MDSIEVMTLKSYPPMILAMLSPSSLSGLKIDASALDAR